MIFGLRDPLQLAISRSSADYTVGQRGAQAAGAEPLGR